MVSWEAGSKDIKRLLMFWCLHCQAWRPREWDDEQKDLVCPICGHVLGN